MKTYFKSLVLTAAAAFTLFSCVKPEIPETINQNELITLKFNIKNADEETVSKALLGTENGKNFLNWENGDKIGTFSVGSFPNSQTTSNNNAGTVVVDENGYTLNVQTFNVGTVTSIYSYYPHSAAAGKNKEAAVVTIPENQTMNAQGFDADAMPMAGEPVTVDLNTTANTDTPCGDIKFSNLGAIVQFKIYSSSPTDETITSVTYKATGIGGTFTIDLTAVDFSDESSLELTSSNIVDEITTSYTTHPSIPTGKANAIPVYMVVAPGTYTGSQIVVTTNAHTYTLNASNAKTYERSHVKPMNVDIQNGTQGDLPVAETWTKVTSAADMTAGTYYILSGDETVSLPNTEAGSAPAVQAFSGTVSNNMKWEATVSGTGLVFKNPTANLYLWGRDDKNDGVRVKQSAPATESFKVWTFTDDADLGVLASVGSTRYLAVYNNSGTLQDWRNYQKGESLTAINHAVFYKLDDNTPSFSVESPLNISESAGSHTVSVTRKNFNGAIAVSVPANCDWITADNVAANANSFGIQVTANTGAERSATLTLSGTGVTSRDLVVTQASGLPSYDFETVAELNALATSTAAAYSGYLTGAVVSYVPDEHNAVIKDETGSVLLYYKDSSHGLLQGQTFTGDLTVTVVLYNSCAEITACDASFTGSTASVSPASVTLENLVGHLSTYQNAYVQVTGLEVTSVSNKNINVTDGTRNYVVYSSPENATCVAGDIISVIGTVAHYGSSDQIKVWATSNINVTGHVTPSYAITFSQPASGGSFTVSVDNANITSGTSVEQGKTVTLTATPASGYTFSGWNVNGATVANASSASTTFTVGTSAVTISASFTSNSGGNTYYVKVSAITSGKQYIMVDNTYSMIFNSASPAQPSAGIDASSLITSEGIVSNATTNSYSVTITSDGTKYKVLLSNGQYLVINSTTNSNEKITSSATGESITITKDDSGFKFISGNRSTRALVYRSGNDFRNYATSNIGASGYGGHFDLYELEN